MMSQFLNSKIHLTIPNLCQNRDYLESPNQRYFAVGCQDGSVSLWDLGSMSEIKKYDCHRDGVWCVAFDKNNANGSRFASVGDDAAIQIYG